jgi:Prokaryotic E2 family E
VLPEPDSTYLAERWPDHTVAIEGSSVVVVLPGYELPVGFEPRRVDLCLILPFGFPETQPDMFWVDPWVTLHGQQPATANQPQQILGRTWQRFSRHLQPGTWRPGVDNLQSWLSAIRTILEREAATGRMAA